MLALAVILVPVLAGAVGLDGPSGSASRVGAGLASGADQVGGFGRDAYPFAELFAHAETRVWRWLVVGGAVSLREDFVDYNYALSRMRSGRSTGLAAQAFVGYDGDRFHLSAGPWIYGDSRSQQAFRIGFLPYGVLRLRVGELDRWHLNLRIADGAPFTAEGAGAAVRLLLGLPPAGGHRLTAGPYFTLGEGAAGISVSDEIELWGRTLRFGGLLGFAYATGFTRPEITAFVGTLL
jgi:hypothetical protein